MTLARHASAPPPTRITLAKAAETDHMAAQNARAARTVAGHAADAEDCSRLLAMLGLDATPRRRGPKPVA
jgi:hypothetical protein